MSALTPEQKEGYAEAAQVSGEVLQHVSPWVNATLVWGLWLLLIAGFLWMDFTMYDVVVTGRGVLRSVQPELPVSVPDNGTVKTVQVQDGVDVHQHDALLVLGTGAGGSMLETVESPGDGRVVFAQHTEPGDTVKQGDVILRILPSNSPLAIDVMVPNASIGHVKKGQGATILLDAYPQQDYGTVEGTVTFVAAEAEHNAELGYPFRIELTLDTTRIGNEDLKPGLAATAEIVTGRESVLDMFLAPFKDMGGHHSVQE